MLSPRKVACIAFPLGYTCQSCAKLSVKRIGPWKGPNVCLGVWASPEASSATWDKAREEHSLGESREGLTAQSVQLTLLLITFNSPFAFFLLYFLPVEHWTVMSQSREQNKS